MYNIFAPEKWWLEDYFPIGKIDFQGQTVKLPGGICPNKKTRNVEKGSNVVTKTHVKAVF